MTALQIEQSLKEIKPLLAKKYKVKKIGYFGSYATGEETSKSDVDVLVEFSEPIGWEFFDLHEFLEKKLNKKVDLVSIKALKDQLKDIILSEVKYI